MTREEATVLLEEYTQAVYDYNIGGVPDAPSYDEVRALADKVLDAMTNV